MKKLFKILGLSLLLLLFLVIVLVIAAGLSQNKIVEITLKKISESIKAPVEVEDASFTLIKRFPYATVELHGVRIGERSDISNPNNPYNEDIVNIKTVLVSVKSVPLFRGEYEIDNIEIDNARLNYRVDSLGASNIDFLLVETDTISESTGAIPSIDLKKAKITNTAVFYDDNSLQFGAKIFIPSLDFEGKIINEKLTGSAEGKLQLTECRFANTTLNQMNEATVNFELDYKTDTLEIIRFEANTDGAKLDVSGKMAFSEKLFARLNLKMPELDFGKLQKFVPAGLLTEYGIEDITGKMEASGSVKGFLSDSVMPFVKLDFDFKNGLLKTKDYPTLKKINFAGEISNGSKRNNITTSAVFKSFHAETQSSTADLTLSLVNMEKPVYDLQSKLKINITEFRDFIPDSVARNLKGEIIAEISTSGQIPDSIDNDYIDFLLNNTFANVDFNNIQFEMDSLNVNNLTGKLNYKPGNLNAKDLKFAIPEFDLQIDNSSFNADLKGKTARPEELDIRLNTFFAESPQGSLWGSGTIKNPVNPDFKLSAGARINLYKLKPFIPDTLIKSVSGVLEAEISSAGKLNFDSIETQLADIIFKQSNISITADKVAVAMPDTLQKLTGLSGKLNLNNGNISVIKTSGVAAGIDFFVDSAYISNIYETVINNKNETVKVYGNLNLGTIDYSTLAPLFSSDSTSANDFIKADNSTMTNEFSGDNKPDDIENRNFLFELKGKIAAKSFQYEKVFLEDISAKFNLSDSVYIFDQIKTKAFDGITNSSVRYSLTKNDKQIINVKTRMENMDIHKLLYAFDNFGYDTLISYENISGIFSSDINSRFVFEADSLVSNDTRILGNFKLNNGKLVNYQPAMDISKFTGIKELDNIEMKTLECNIFMFKNKIYVPITKIISSSMDLSTFGMQSMGDDYEYHIQMKLSEILKGKSQKLFERQSSLGDEASVDEADKNTVKLIYGYVDGKKKVGFATRRAQKQMELKIQVQQKMLELIFHPTLVSFDTGVK